MSVVLTFLLNKLQLFQVLLKHLSTMRGTLELAVAILLVMVVPFVAAGFASSALTEGLGMKWAQMIVVPGSYAVMLIAALYMPVLAIPFVWIGLRQANDEFLRLVRRRTAKA